MELVCQSLQAGGKEGDARIWLGAADLVVQDVEDGGDSLFQGRQSLPGVDAGTAFSFGFLMPAGVAIVVLQEVGQIWVSHAAMIHEQDRSGRQSQAEARRWSKWGRPSLPSMKALSQSLQMPAASGMAWCWAVVGRSRVRPPHSGQSDQNWSICA